MSACRAVGKLCSEKVAACARRSQAARCFISPKCAAETSALLAKPRQRSEELLRAEVRSQQSGIYPQYCQIFRVIRSLLCLRVLHP